MIERKTGADEGAGGTAEGQRVRPAIAETAPPWRGGTGGGSRDGGRWLGNPGHAATAGSVLSGAPVATQPPQSGG